MPIARNNVEKSAVAAVCSGTRKDEIVRDLTDAGVTPLCAKRMVAAFVSLKETIAKEGTDRLEAKGLDAWVRRGTVVAFAPDLPPVVPQGHSLPWYPTGTPSSCRRAARIGALALAGTVLLACMAWNHKCWLTWLYGLAAAWVIVPPVWFWYEYHYIYCVKGQLTEFDKFKHGQQTGLAIWAGVAVALGVYISGDHFKAPSPAPGAAQPVNPENKK
jgi:hypothetical protein